MLIVAIHNDREHQQLTLREGGLALGSAHSGGMENTLRSCAIHDADMPLEQLHLDYQPAAPGQISLTNVGRSLVTAEGRRIVQGEQAVLPLPLRLFAGKTRIDLREDASTCLPEEMLKTIQGGRQAGQASPFSLNLFGRSPAPETLVRWLEAMGKLQHAAAGSPEFFGDAAQAVLDNAGLDTGLVLLRQAAGWTIVASRLRSAEQSVIHYQPALIEQAARQKCTSFHDAQAMRAAASHFLEAAVASPIFDQQGEVTAILYGVRSAHVRNQRRGVRHLEAQLVQQLAETMTIGLERQRREAEAARRQILLEQAFSPELASQLQHNPQLLEGHEREITVLFSDMRGFFELSERLGPHETYRFLSDVMNRLTESIMARQGVIIDYYGDGLAAMWNAPTDQPDHAQLACQAAHAMLDELPAINAKWRTILGRDLALGIGIHTGLARVGNAGTERRIKYGPRGATVNLASRVEGATKRLGVALLVTEQTRQRLPANSIVRRVCQAQLAGAAAPVNLYEVPHGAVTDQRVTRIHAYEDALAAFEAGDLSLATQRLVTLAESDCDQELALQFLLDHLHRLSQKDHSRGELVRDISPVLELPK